MVILGVASLQIFVVFLQRIMGFTENLFQLEFFPFLCVSIPTSSSCSGGSGGVTRGTSRVDADGETSEAHVILQFLSSTLLQ